MARDVAPIFADIDGMNADKFISHLTPDVRFRFANMDPAIGHAAVKEGVEGFWTTIDGLTHHILKVHEVGDTVIVQIDVEYRRKDGKSVTVPNCDVLVFDGDLVRDWQIYIDLAPVFAFTDEFYQAQAYSRDKIRVLLRLDVAKMPPNAVSG